MRTKNKTPFIYNKLWQKIAEDTDFSKSAFFAHLGISSQTLNSMLNSYGINLKTIDTICAYFKCQPEDIMELE